MPEASPRGTLLLVDDEAYVRDSLSRVLERRGFVVRTAAGAEEILASAEAAGATGDRVAETLAGELLAGVDVVITDLRMPTMDGLTLLRELRARAPRIPVVVLTGHGTVPSAVECMKAGAFEYLLKPADHEQLTWILGRALREAEVHRELAYLREQAGPRTGGGAAERPLGDSAPWKHALELAEAAAPYPTPVLLLGESGSGKEVLARHIHASSPRAERAFVSVNCAAVPSELFESEFFGHRRGAFTGAVADREGRFRVAHRGTLFLDEVNSLSPRAQAKVLRVLEHGTFERVGESRPTTVDIRLICASNTDLETAVEDGRFRRDLLYRINAFTLGVPPLRDRPEDIPVLARAFLRELSSRLGRSVLRLAPETLEHLIAYAWPGNVRELRNVLERGVLLEEGESLSPESLPFHLRPAGGAGDDGSPEAAGRGAVGLELRLPGLDLRASLAHAEKALLATALERAGGVRREAARLLGVDERNLGYFLKKHGLMDAGKRGSA